ncbi:MAG: N-6 DNA methylase [Treponema sp.]|nr:N-6 DNA methylase [Treponema sp.]
MGPKGKWQYLYPKDLLHPIKALQSLFGFKEEKINEDYEKANIKKEYSTDKKTFCSHILEYFTNKLKWDAFFAKKENREKTAKPVKQKEAAAAAVVEKIAGDQPGLFGEKEIVSKEDKKPTLNRSLMRKVWELYNPAAKTLANADKAPYTENVSKEANNGRRAENSPGTGQGELSAGTPAVRDAGGEGAGDFNVPGGKTADNEREPVRLPVESGGRSGGNLRERRGRSAIKAVREQVKELLASKTDSEMTESDKALLRQYEGAGGLAEKGASNHGTLYEFYTPQKVVDKVWSLVDKYNPSPNKEVIEPSAGTGRFAEGRGERFSLFELDETSARIAGILHPEAEVKQGAFQELFMNGRTPKKSYDGKKYDVAVGNPPYGEYSGIYKGYGEGKEHTKIDEYFIDRTLDTLKDGGVLAMVVPSSFLRGKNSKAKEKIAGKARLLEAWRLPNGTFGTTGVGTDIIVLRKEKGDTADYNDNAYFSTNEDHIVGIETERIGRFGAEKYVAPYDGMTFDQALDIINPEKVPVTQKGELAPEQAADEKVEVKESEAEEHQNRSEAMKGNDNAKKDFHKDDEKQGRKKKSSTDNYVRSIGKNMSADEYNAQYGVMVDKKDMPIWAVTNYDGKIDVDRLSVKNREWLKSSGHFTHDAAGNWYSIANYASGNIYDKLDQLEKEKDELGAELYAVNKSILETVKPSPKAAENIFVSPISDFAKEYKIADDEGAEMDLRDAFRKWAQVRTYNWGRGKRAKSQDNWNADTSPISEYEIPPNITFNDVMAYIRQEPVQTDRATAREFDKETAKMEAAKKRDSRRECAERLFNRFIREGLPEEQRKELVETWNRRFNSVVNPDYTQIPTFVDGMNTHKGEKEYKLLPCQVKGISFLCNKGNGILAHEVGVGKALANYEKVLTPGGWVENGSLKVGDMVYAVDGTPAKILNVYPQGKKDIYRVVFHDGSTVDCTDDHLWAVKYPWARCKAQNPKDKDGITVKSLKELLPDLRNKKGQRKLAIPMCDPVQFEKKKLPLHPYLLGILIGDGCFRHNGPSVTLPDEPIKDKIEGLLPNGIKLVYADKYDYRIISEHTTNESGQFEKSNEIKNAIENMGLYGLYSHEKYIPHDYKYSSVDDRAALLQGLMDADGYIDIRGLTPIYYTTSEKLAFDVKELVQSLGGIVSIKTKLGRYKAKNGDIKECRLCYCISLRLQGINPFTLPRKAGRVKEKTKYIPVRYIDRVEYIGESEASCIRIDHHSHLYITHDYVVTHNTVQGGAATVNQIKTGRAKRPLVCVPKAVYSKWVKEFHQHFPDMVINELGNFSDKDIAKFKSGDTSLNIPEGTISVCTYEALQKVTFKDETITTDLINDMMDSQTIYDNDGNDQRSPKEIEEERNKMMEKLGRGAKAKEGAFFWEETGFDCITVDEVHNFKNVFGGARSFSASVKEGDDQERQSNEFKGLTGGTSDRAMKLFAITQLIQKQNNGRNVFGLSATPFTNSPIEVYNMLSLVARNKLKELHIYNMYEFLAQFAEIKSEWSVTADGDIKQKDVMTHWKNLGALQNLITEYMDYVTADDADVIRPIKKEHLPELELTPVQKAIIAAETEYMTNADPKEDPGAVLKAINNMRLAALSPAAISSPSADYSKYEGWPKGLKLRSEDFVTSSPKLKFVCDSVTECYKHQPSAGQIIYLPRGVNDFVHVKEYLMKQGMPEDSIAFMSSKTTLEEKERIKMDFNDPDGKTKVIIGSETIKEGVSLNGNTTTIYNCMLGWNPTETIQVEGRAWRQGNKQGHVHVVYPLMADSIDSLMYQKYHEKASRIDEVWSFKGDTSGDVSDINPETLRFDLIKDPARKAKLIVGQKKEKITADRRIEEARYEVLFKDNRNLSIAEESLPEQKRDMDVAEAAMMKARKMRDEAQKAYDKAVKEKGKEFVDEATRFADDLRHAKWELEQATSSFRRERKTYKEIQDDVERYHAKFKKMSIRLGKVDEKLKEISANIQSLKQQEEAIENSYNTELEKAKRELAAAGQKIPPLKEQTADNVKSIMGNLRPMDEYKESIKAARERGDTRSTKEIIREMDRNWEAERKQTKKALSAIIGRKTLLIMKKSVADNIRRG